jgi:hypothetical protein
MPGSIDGKCGLPLALQYEIIEISMPALDLLVASRRGRVGIVYHTNAEIIGSIYPSIISSPNVSTIG